MVEEELQTQVSTVEEHVEEHAVEHAGSTDETAAPDNQEDEYKQHAVTEPVGATSDDAHVNGASEVPAQAIEVAEESQQPGAVVEPPVEPTPATAASPPESPKKAAPASPVKSKVAGRPSVATKPAANKAASTPATPIVKKVRAN